MDKRCNQSYTQLPPRGSKRNRESSHKVCSDFKSENALVLAGREIKGQVLENLASALLAQGRGENKTHVVMTMGITNGRSSVQRPCTSNGLTSWNASNEGQRHDQVRGTCSCYCLQYVPEPTGTSLRCSHTHLRSVRHYSWPLSWPGAIRDRIEVFFK